MKISYLSGIPTRLNISDENFEISDNTTFENLLNMLANRGGPFTIFQQTSVFFGSVENKVLQRDSIIKNTDQIAIFSPIAGG